MSKAKVATERRREEKKKYVQMCEQEYDKEVYHIEFRQADEEWYWCDRSLEFIMIKILELYS